MNIFYKKKKAVLWDNCCVSLRQYLIWTEPFVCINKNYASSIFESSPILFLSSFCESQILITMPTCIVPLISVEIVVGVKWKFFLSFLPSSPTLFISPCSLSSPLKIDSHPILSILFPSLLMLIFGKLPFFVCLGTLCPASL